MRIKICGITKLEQGLAIASLGVDTLGFICFPSSPRYLKPPDIQLITRELPSTISKIGVFVDASCETIITTTKIANFTGVQLHGAESPQFCAQLRQILPGVEIIKAFRVQNIEALDANLAIYANYVDTFLFDAYHPQLPGGTGKTLDWSSLVMINSPLPWLLAGGLTPENVSLAIRQTNPDGLDISSGVERSPGDKDLALVDRLLNVTLRKLRIT